jgi:hypothetical protein
LKNHIIINTKSEIHKDIVHGLKGTHALHQTNTVKEEKTISWYHGAAESNRHAQSGVDYKIQAPKQKL